ncbi:hypothetical protein [Methylobacterium pseudosasicola]|uniref:UrcA family protein n=1 Tax=Methylobacterium pseudosasicola TaxID=582667 RepID=A0A1I4GK20_9HYPH|nr:hypothetical protein [Methylobacterium pseudosasicola]SFL29476.1 hypothetical protein SAMN05192568_10033 [Methylobacterium pseudosasicola]
MPPASLRSLLLLAATLLVSGPVRADSETEMRHGGWRDCLSRNFRIQAALTDPDLAADAAFRACRGAEEAYLAALARSPLLDDDDIARARPMLAGRIRAWLVGSRG